jgi:hypothetical protein
MSNVAACLVLKFLERNFDQLRPLAKDQKTTAAVICLGGMLDVGGAERQTLSTMPRRGTSAAGVQKPTLH